MILQVTSFTSARGRRNSSIFTIHAGDHLVRQFVSQLIYTLNIILCEMSAFLNMFVIMKSILNDGELFHSQLKVH